MSILTRVLQQPQERFDLEDFNLLLSALRADSHYYTQNIVAATSFIVSGFSVIQSSLGQTTATVDLSGATLVNGNNTGDFSWWTAPVSIPTLVLPIGVNGLIPGRNYVSLQLYAQDGVPLQRAFWDPTANSGAGSEFSQTVNTVTQLFVKSVINQSGFNLGDTTQIPLAIIDLNNSGIVQGIQDQRNMIFRLGSPTNVTSGYVWNSQIEPGTTLTFNTASSIPFVVGETVTFTSGATALVQTGGTNNIVVYDFSNVDYNLGDVVLGSTSNGSGGLLSYYTQFNGADKDIANYRDMFAALMNEIRTLKGSSYWFQSGNVVSLNTLLNLVNSMMVPISAGARFKWSGNALSITDNKTSGQALSDVIGAIRIPGYSGNVYFTRQDGTGGSATIGIADGYVMYVTLPAPGTSITYSEAGSGSTNFQVVAIADFTPTDSNYIIAYREGSLLRITGIGELQSGETTPVGDPITRELLAYIGAASETSTNPQYTTTPSVHLSNQFTDNDSLTQAISINTANINDIVAGLTTPYEELLTVVAGAPANSNQITGPVSSTTTLTLPLDHRNSNAQKQYIVGSGALIVFLRGQKLQVGSDYTELGTAGTYSSTIEILQNLIIGDTIDFLVINPQAFGTATLDQPFYTSYIVGQNGSDIPVGALYNLATGRLQVYRDGLAMVDSLVVGNTIDQYQESTQNAIIIEQAANPSELFTFVNFASPNPIISYMSGLNVSVLTVPSYTIGNGTLEVFRNGVLLSTNASAPTDLKYTETSTSTITLALAATVPDVFAIFVSGTVPSYRISITGVTGATVTLPGGHTFTPGTQALLVYRNGVLMANSTVVGDIVSQYQQMSNDAITLQVAAVSSDFFEFILV